MDGNFKADHMKMKRSDDDVKLTDGEGYFVAEASYQQHLETAKGVKEVIHDIIIKNGNLLFTPLQEPTCVNHKAASAVTRGQKNIDITGILGCACAAHGCVIPNSMVNMYTGER